MVEGDEHRRIVKRWVNRTKLTRKLLEVVTQHRKSMKGSARYSGNKVEHGMCRARQWGWRKLGSKNIKRPEIRLPSMYWNTPFQYSAELFGRRFEIPRLLYRRTLAHLLQHRPKTWNILRCGCEVLGLRGWMWSEDLVMPHSVEHSHRVWLHRTHSQHIRKFRFWLR